MHSIVGVRLLESRIVHTQSPIPVSNRLESRLQNQHSSCYFHHITFVIVIWASCSNKCDKCNECYQALQFSTMLCIWESTGAGKNLGFWEKFLGF